MNASILKQFNDLKKKHPDAMLLFRCGDFYETYEDDAATASRILGITLTKQNDTKVRMAGFPYHALDTYLPKLIRAGQRVAICDQIDYQLAKKPTKRSITDLVKPSKAITLPTLTKEQYDLLCECIRYRCADNQKERQDAQLHGQFTGWYDDMSKKLEELKSLIYDIKAS